jgi:uncharacterized membrane protein
MIYYTRKPFVFFIFSGLIVWILGIILAPILAASNLPYQLFSKVLYFFYNPVCHQISERSIYILNYPLAVCARCFSFYAIGLLTSLIYLYKNTIKLWEFKYYLLLLLPLLFDFTMEKLGLYNDLIFIRLITGGMLGFVVFHLLMISVSPRVGVGSSMVKLKHNKI